LESPAARSIGVIESIERIAPAEYSMQDAGNNPNPLHNPTPTHFVFLPTLNRKPGTRNTVSCILHLV
jgi:hypothetical protein